MKTALVAAVFAIASLPLLGQQTSPGSPPSQLPNQPTNPAIVPATVPEQSAPSQPAATSEPTAPSQPSAAEMRPVKAELVGKIDSSTAKTGDNVAVKTRGSVKTADGTEIPKGCTLTGHVVAVRASGGQQTAQVVLDFDRAELKGGQTLPIHTEIESISPAGGAGPTDAADAMNDSNAIAGPGSSSMPAAGASPAAGPQGVPNAAATNPAYGAAGSAARPGTIVSRNGNIAIRTTSIPGVLLANNAPGQQDPRMAQASGILLSAKKEVKLDGGTELVLGVASTGTAQ